MEATLRVVETQKYKTGEIKHFSRLSKYAKAQGSYV